MPPRRKPKKHCTVMRLVGAQVALFRCNAGYTQAALAELLRVSEETIASIEQGRRPLLPDIAQRLDELLNTGGALWVAVENMPDQEQYPVWAQEFVDCEQKAIALSSYETVVVPGLLQTEKYARATFHCKVHPFSEEEISQLVTARLERQAVLHRKQTVLASFIIYEAVLLSRLGGPEAAREQIRHLRACADLPGVSIQVLRLDREIHAGISGPFVLLEMPDHQHLAYTESHRGSLLTSSSEEVSALSQKYGMLRMQALNAEETKGLLDRLLGET
ncbi:Scr1 family TA system antitoxin-like transcriptional regulator [Streptomyces sp. NPDC057654]|uniref:helix-turn-helix domain-containing protein n=1 Tax=Streptomyces sp. NPDC057654 TaxID=3346196 RepID=UPI0036862081